MTIISSEKMEKTKRNIWFAYATFLMFWGLAYYAQLVGYFLSNSIFAYVASNTVIISDFVLWYNAALLAQKCLVSPINIYDPLLQQAGIDNLILPLKTNIPALLQYPPQFFAVMLPFAWLKMPAAYLLWCGTSLLLILWSMRCMVKKIVDSSFAQFILILGTLTSHASYFAFANGQTTLFHFPALIWFWLWLREKKFFAAGLLSAVFLIKLQFLPFLVPIGLILGGMKYLKGLLISCSIFAIYTVSITGWSNIVGYPRALQSMESTAVGVASEIMQNCRGQLAMFLSPGPTLSAISLLIYAVSILFVIFLWKFLLPRVEKNLGSRAFDLVVSITTIVMLICSPHTHMQDYMAIFILAAFLYSRVFASGAREWYFKLSRALIISFPIYSWASIFLFFLLVPMHVQPYFVWACILFVALLADLKTQIKLTGQTDIPGLSRDQL